MLAIRDLPYNKELSKEAMGDVLGGWRKIRSYAYYRYSGWRRVYRSSFRRSLWYRGRRRSVIGYNEKWQRVQSFYRGATYVNP